MIHQSLLVIAGCFIWIFWSFIVGFLFNKVKQKSLSNEHTYVTTNTSKRLRVLGIHKWKDMVPEAGAMFKGGTSKKQLESYSSNGLTSFMIETRRAEYVHYLILLITPLFLLFNDPLIASAMIAYGLIANIPCILIQRYNRSRIMKVLNTYS